MHSWEQRKLGEVFKEYSEKNHTELPALTIIQGGGTVKREEADRNLMYDESNLSNYKMVRKDDFIVHLRSFEGGLEKSSLDGIISPAYHTFHSDVADSRFYYPYFRSHEFIKHKLVPHVYGIRDGRKRLILLRPYQIHAIESIREASKTGKSGYVWHTTGSGKTLTSYKATRNLLMDIPAIDKAIFLIDRKDLDTQTTMAFQAYANNDLVDVDETDNVNDLKKKLRSDDRQVIVTTIQKMQILVSKRLQEGTPEYNKIKNLKIAFVVDECHRAVTPKTKRELERFFGRSLWYGFTGTPRFAENPYPQMGDLPRTTEELYGERLHRYTIQNAIHDKAVLGFQVEHNGPKNIADETDSSAYDNETHMLKIDYEYIINLIQNIVTPAEEEEEISPEEKQRKIAEVLQYVEELRKSNGKVAEIMCDLIGDIEEDDTKYRGKSILNIVENMKRDCINTVIADFCSTWCASKDDVMYAAMHYRNGEIPNESAIKATVDYTKYKAGQEKPLPKFKYFSQMMADLRMILEEEIKPLLITV